MKVYDDREAFYQWDLNQKIKSELFKEGDEVHFGQSRSSVALVVKTYKEGDDIVADVPNVLLQSTRKIFAFQYVKDGEREYTTNEHTFSIIPRPKPEDYVYTETEILNIEYYVDLAIEKAKERGELAYTCKTYANYAEMVGDLNTIHSDVYVEGQDIRILTLDVPDLWVAYVDRDYAEYTYTDDNAIIEALNADGFVKIGYYRLGALETQKVDLLDYVKNTDYATAEKAGIVKTNANLGFYIDNTGMLSIVQAQENDITSKSNKFRPITPYNLDLAVKVGITTNGIELTEDEKAAVRNWIGAVKKPEKDIGGYYRVPITDAHGADGFLRAYNAPLQFAVVLYGTGGVVKTNAPIVDNDCANKKYVDDTLGDIESALDELHAYAQSLIGGDA